MRALSTCAWMCERACVKKMAPKSYKQTEWSFVIGRAFPNFKLGLKIDLLSRKIVPRNSMSEIFLQEDSLPLTFNISLWNSSMPLRHRVKTWKQPTNFFLKSLGPLRITWVFFSKRKGLLHELYWWTVTPKICGRSQK